MPKIRAAIARGRAKIKPSKQLSGILLMMAHALAMAIMYVAGKHLATGLPSKQVVFVYKFSIFLFALPFCFARGIKGTFKTKKMHLHLTRAVVSTLGSFAFFKALKHVELADATAICYMENAILLSIGLLYFKEHFHYSKLVAVLLSCIAALFIIKPGFDTFNPYYGYIFAALGFWTVNNLTIKELGKTEKTHVQLFYSSGFSSIIALYFAFEVWEELRAEHILPIVTLGLAHMVHSLAFFRALKLSDISTVMPFDYSRLLFTGVLGYMFFSEVPDNLSIVGYILIALSGIILIHYQAKEARRSKNRKKQEDLEERLENEYEKV
jgi:drug/metabolite transporter (DMT)-like permease